MPITNFLGKSAYFRSRGLTYTYIALGLLILIYSSARPGEFSFLNTVKRSVLAPTSDSVVARRQAPRTRRKRELQTPTFNSALYNSTSFVEADSIRDDFLVGPYSIDSYSSRAQFGVAVQRNLSSSIPDPFDATVDRRLFGVRATGALVAGGRTNTQLARQLTFGGRGFSPSQSKGGIVNANGKQRAAEALAQAADNGSTKNKLTAFASGVYQFLPKEDLFYEIRFAPVTNGAGLPVGTLRESSTTAPQVEFSGNEGLQVWNELFSELYLIVEEPELLGSLSSKGFVLKRLEESNVLRILNLLEGDSVISVNGKDIREFTSDDLVDAFQRDAISVVSEKDKLPRVMTVSLTLD